jgi:hypothetical protein
MRLLHPLQHLLQMWQRPWHLWPQRFRFLQQPERSMQQPWLMWMRPLHLLRHLPLM